MMEKKKQKNAYVCSNLHSIVTINKDEGTTPMFITCPFCDARSTSMMGNINQELEPTYEWFLPTEDEVIQEATEAAKLYDMPVESAIESFKDHWRNGGLSLRAIKKVTE